MARNLAAFLVLFLALSICEAAKIYEPISDLHRSAALELFTSIDGLNASLEDTYEALRVFDILAIEKNPDGSTTTCQKVLENLGSSSPPKDLFYALKVNNLLKCWVNEEVFEAIASRLKATINDASTLLDIYYSIGSLVLIKDQASDVDVLLADADGTFHSIKDLSQSDGRWHYSSNNPDSSTYASGLALEALAGVVSLAASEVDQSRINTVKNDILKLFDSIEKYDDGSFYFDGKIVSTHEHQSSLSTTASVVRGLTAFADVVSEKLNLPGDKILGLAKFFLGIGIPGDVKDFFNQVESLAFLESNRVSIPLILSLPATVCSVTQKDQLKVRVSTVLGSAAPPLTVKLVRAVSTDANDLTITERKELQYEPKSGLHVLDFFSKNVDVGNYVFVFEMVLKDSDSSSDFTTGGQIHVPIYITGVIKVGNAEIAVLDSDLGSIETQKALDFAGNGIVSLSANHLQKLRLSFQLTTPYGRAFNPQQAFLKLRHETKVEHVFVVERTGEKFEIILDFLGLVEKFFYLSGRYDIELTVGDSVMENSFLRPLGHVELDLPVAPEKASRPPPPPVCPYSRYGPKAEITHLFRAPEKRPPQNMSLTFLCLTLLPFIGFLVGSFIMRARSPVYLEREKFYKYRAMLAGTAFYAYSICKIPIQDFFRLLRIGVNLKNFPSATVPATYAVLFHIGIASVLLLYVLFWLKLDLFTTLKTLGFLGALLLFFGHRILSHLASTSAKLKSA